MQSDFFYTGKIPKESQLDVKKMLASKYNGYLVLNPMDTSCMDTHKAVAAVGIPLPGNVQQQG